RSTTNNRYQDNGFGAMDFNQPKQNNFSNFSANQSNNNFEMHDFMNDNSSFSDFGEDFPSNLDDDFMQDVVNPFKED
ncbi:single-stranded DNA-binding protein, partial [Gemella palaticanis]|nr:single-stranded DNA-binding protein [Gemella palaticanis]NYS47921.1 single-stranded DNA-binding protein [Gemella palaticanis]